MSAAVVCDFLGLRLTGFLGCGFPPVWCIDSRGLRLAKSQIKCEGIHEICPMEAFLKQVGPSGTDATLSTVTRARDVVTVL